MGATSWVPRTSLLHCERVWNLQVHPESYEHRFCNRLTALVRKTSAGARNNATMRYVAP